MINLNHFSFITKVETKDSSLISENSIKYISINAPYTIINSLPFCFKSIFRIDHMNSSNDDEMVDINPEKAELISVMKENKREEIKEGRKELNVICEDEIEDDSNDSYSHYQDAHSNFEELTKYQYIKLDNNEELNLLNLRPDVNFSLSIQPPMYKPSNFLKIKYEDENDENEENKDDQFSDDNISQHSNNSDEAQNGESQLINHLKKKCNFRFLK
jgi:hypothetical protein